MDAWEMNLRDGMSRFGMNDLNYWNKNLTEWTEEWLKVVESVDGIALVKKSKNADEIEISVKLKESDLKFEGRLKFYTRESQFALKISTIEKYTKNFPEFFPQWVDEELNEIEIREREFVLENLNFRFRKFLEWFENREVTWKNL